MIEIEIELKSHEKDAATVLENLTSVMRNFRKYDFKIKEVEIEVKKDRDDDDDDDDKGNGEDGGHHSSEEEQQNVLSP